MASPFLRRIAPSRSSAERPPTVSTSSTLPATPTLAARWSGFSPWQTECCCWLTPLMDRCHRHASSCKRLSRTVSSRWLSSTRRIDPTVDRPRLSMRSSICSSVLKQMTRPSISPSSTVQAVTAGAKKNWVVKDTICKRSSMPSSNTSPPHR